MHFICRYRKLALKYHPQKNFDAKAEVNFKNVAEAYDVLNNRELSFYNNSTHM